MAADVEVIRIVDELIAGFERRSLDLPDGVFTRDTQFFLNGVAFEELLGRPASDPLVRMLARGAAGYRFILKAVQHAVPDGELQRGEFHAEMNGEIREVRGQCWLSGRFRGAGGRAEILIDIAARMRGTAVERAAATIDPDSLAKLRDARLQN